jgi:hypothetical protein
MTNQSGHVLLHQILESVGRCLTADSAKQLLDLRADPALQEKIDQFANKSTAGTLTAEERSEYEAIVAAATLIGILQAKARAMLAPQTAA